MGRSAGALFLSDEEEGSFGVGGAAGVRDCMFVLASCWIVRRAWR